jgi:RNA recognition motif-containing protein
MNIYAGNLSYDVTEEDLQTAFQAFGAVESANVIKDRFSGESRGFGFVEMPSKDEGKAAIEGLNGKELKGKSITVNEARPKSNDRGGDRGGRGGGGGRRGGGGGGYGGHGGGGGGYGGGGGGGRRRY